jgi:hypothetical protein
MRIAAGLDVTTANMARVYDYWRGGKESFAADRAQAAAIEALCPPGNGPRQMTARNRAYLERAASSAFGDGIGQLIDLGVGFCTPRPLHSVPGAARRQARVAYVDMDPGVVSHGKAATDAVPGVSYAHADLTRPGEVMAHPDVRSVIDPARPCLAGFGLILHFTDADGARRVISGWAAWLPAGSRIAVTVAYWSDVRLHERIRAAYGPAPVHNHGQQQVQALFRGLDLLGGGVEGTRGGDRRPWSRPGPGRSWPRSRGRSDWRSLWWPPQSARRPGLQERRGFLRGRRWRAADRHARRRRGLGRPLELAQGRVGHDMGRHQGRLEHDP